MGMKYLAAVSIFILLSVAQCLSQTEQSLVLRGTVVTPTEILPDGIVSVSGSKIADVGIFSNRSQHSSVETDSFIFPGLIDLHDHITWNLLPRWKPGELFSNRYEWQQRTAYKIALDGPHAKLAADHALICDAERV